MLQMFLEVSDVLCLLHCSMSILATPSLWTPCSWGRGGPASSSTSKRWEGLSTGNVPRCLGHHEAILLLVGILVLDLPGGLQVISLPILLSSLLDEVLLHDLQVVNALFACFLIPRNHHKGRVFISSSGESDVHLELLHDVPDALATSTNDHAVHLGINVDLHFHHTLVLANNLQDLILGRLSIARHPRYDHQIRLGLRAWHPDVQ